jgi:MtN3 and saliva related transmembrane protein
MVTTVLGIMAGTWGVVMAISPLLQIRKIVQLRSSRDVSIGYMAVLIVGFSLWIAYGIAIANAALIVPNCVALLVGLATIVVARRYRGRPEAREPSDAERP